MNLKKMVAIALAVAITGVVSVTAPAASDAGGSADAVSGRKRNDSLTKLLEDGVISQETYDKIGDYLENNMPQLPDLKNKLDGARNGGTNTLDELLDAGVITQGEYDALKAAMEAKMAETKAAIADKMSEMRGKLASGEKPSAIERPQPADPSAQFVEDGIISQETADAIKAYFEANRPAKTGDVQRPERIDMFQKMLDEGVITQEEYDALKTAMPQRAERTKPQDKQSSESES